MMNLKENFMLGALAYKFKTVNKSLTNVDGHELDVFSVWSVNKNSMLFRWLDSISLNTIFIVVVHKTTMTKPMSMRS